MSDVEAMLSVRALTKSFYGVRALDAVDFNLRPGEIHALIGENGAGKSTFIKILAGVYTRDGGEIFLEGRAVDPRSESLPIAFVHQDPAFAEDLSIGENIAFGAGYPRRMGMIDWNAVNRQALEIYATMDVEPLDPERMVSTLRAPEKAILSIVRTLAHTPKVLVLDEPTAALPEADSIRLFQAMKKLRDRGTSMIYVSHRLNDLFGLCDRVTAFRDGRHIITEDMAATTGSRMVEHMLGRAVEKVGEEKSHSENEKGPIALSVKDLTIDGRGPLSFNVHAGEILGLVGLRGGGQEAIGRAIFGAAPIDAGTMNLFGTQLSNERSIAQSIEAGVRLLAGDRLSESTFAGMSVAENILVNPAIRGKSIWRWAAPSRERKEAEELLERFDVRPRKEGALIDWLSGGNQQKACLARWLGEEGRLVVLEEPTAGVDIGAKLAIHEILKRASARGVAMIVVSTDMEEVATLCDRAIVINRGRASAELTGAELTMESLVSQSSQGGTASPRAAHAVV